MSKNIVPPPSDFKIRCPRLGHQISFAYCRVENRGLPCFKTIDCWFQHFPVESHLRLELTPEQWTRTFKSPPRPKMLSLLDLIEQAKAR
jgi:hypothetical protein